MITLPLARSSDPLTSFQGADTAKVIRVAQWRQIVSALRIHGPMGVSRIAAFTDLNSHEVGKRVIELQRDELIELTGANDEQWTSTHQRAWKAV